MTAPVDGSGEDPTWTESVLKPSERGFCFDEVTPLVWWPLVTTAGFKSRAGDIGISGMERGDEV